MTIGWCFDNTYSKLPDPFKEEIDPVPVKNPELVVLNKSLSKKLNLDFSNLDNKKISELLNKVRLPSPETMAQRYPHELSGGPVSYTHLTLPTKA